MLTILPRPPPLLRLTLYYLFLNPEKNKKYFIVILSMALSLVRSIGVSFEIQGQSGETLQEEINLVKSDPTLAQECARQLDLLFEACQTYRRATGQLPATLTDLLSDYISDESILVCPVARRLESYSLGQDFYNNFDSDPLTTYYNEFNDRRVRTYKNTVINLTEREIKHRIREETPVGNRVPIIRCLNHKKSLRQVYKSVAINLSYEGKIYESDPNWESSFVNEIPASYIVPALIIRGPVSERMSPRKTDNPNLLDLSAVYNGLFEDPWWVGDGNYGLIELQTKLRDGIGEFNGIQFDVRGVIQLAGAVVQEGGFSYLVFPNQVRPIGISGQSKRIHILCGTLYDAEVDTEIATLTVFFENSDDTVLLPIKYGRNVERMQFDVTVDQDVESPVPAWTGDDRTSENPNDRLRIYTTSFSNPRPDEVIECLQFESARTKSAPFILAISVE